MLSNSVLAEYVAIVVGLLLVPGPSVILTLSRSSVAGHRIGMATALGIAVGDVLHAGMAALGLSAMLMTSDLAFQALKYAGVAYLVVTGARLLLAKGGAARIKTTAIVGAPAAFKQAILTEVLNPKTALFFLSLLPQFVRPGAGSSVAQLATLGIVFVVMDLSYLLAIVMVANMMKRWLDRPATTGHRRERVIGAIYISLGLRLALAVR